MSKSLLALACVAAIYGVLAFLVLPQDAVFSSDEGLKFIQLQNFTRKGWRDFTIDYPGRDLDPELSYVPINNPPPLIRDGKIFAVYPIFFPLLATPLYQHLHYTGLYLIPLLSGLLTLALSAYLVRLTGEDDHWPVLLLIGLGTPLLFYSLLFWDHTLGTMLSTLALILVKWEGGQARLPQFHEKQFFYARDPEDYQRLTKTFLTNGIHDFAVVTYPVPMRGVVDPLNVAEGYVVRAVNDQLLETQEADGDRQR